MFSKLGHRLPLLQPRRLFSSRENRGDPSLALRVAGETLPAFISCCAGGYLGGFTRENEGNAAFAALFTIFMLMSGIIPALTTPLGVTAWVAARRLITPSLPPPPYPWGRALVYAAGSWTSGIYVYSSGWTPGKQLILLLPFEWQQVFKQNKADTKSVQHSVEAKEKSS